MLERTPEPPTPPSPLHVTPPTPPNISWYDSDEEGMDIFTNGKKSIVTHDEDGNKVIIIEDGDGSESKITLKNGIIKIDGEDFNLSLIHI